MNAERKDDSFVQRLIRASMPNPNRPRLPDELEREFVDIDTRSAAVYADLELAGARVQQFLAAEGTEPADDGGAVPIAIDPEAEASLANHVAAARLSAQVLADLATDETEVVVAENDLEAELSDNRTFVRPATQRG